MTTTITHKVRNPIYNETNYTSNTTLDQRWLNIWDAKIENNGDIIITPSNNWAISGEQIKSIAVTKVINDGNTHNVTINTPVTSNTLAKIDNNGNLIAGPQINPSNGSTTKFLNEKGEWIQPNIEGTTPIIVTIPTTNTAKWIITHTIANNNWTTDQIIKLNNNAILTIDKYGHVIEKNDITIPQASDTSAGLVPKTSTADANKILQISSDGKSIAWINPSTAIPKVTASANGLIPNYGNNANGKILIIDSSNNPIWVDPTSNIPTVTSGKNGLVPNYDSNANGKILRINENGDAVWTEQKFTTETESLTYTKLKVNSEEYTQSDTIPDKSPAGRLTLRINSLLTNAALTYIPA